MPTTRKPRLRDQIPAFRDTGTSGRNRASERSKARDLSLSATTTDLVLHVASGPVALTRFQFCAEAAVTQSGVNHWLIEVVDVGLDGTGTTVVASWSTNTDGALAKHVPVDLKFATGLKDREVKDGNVLIVRCTKTGTPVNLVGRIVARNEAILP